MRFLVDHDVPSDVSRMLSQAGHEVLLVRDALGPVASDREVLSCAVARQLVLISCNRDDFVRLCGAEPHSGLIILVRRRTRIAECAALLRLIRSAGESGIAGGVNFA